MEPCFTIFAAVLPPAAGIHDMIRQQQHRSTASHGNRYTRNQRHGIANVQSWPLNGPSVKTPRHARVAAAESPPVSGGPAAVLLSFNCIGPPTAEEVDPPTKAAVVLDWSTGAGSGTRSGARSGGTDAGTAARTAAGTGDGTRRRDSSRDSSQDSSRGRRQDSRWDSRWDIRWDKSWKLNALWQRRMELDAGICRGRRF